ncbi:hypothetical protein ACFQ88_23485 [Paenibacillus sp. NPDC056579]|uniref:hypothetical protein n=1 Tax=Paenibacillus sp. NPDC056579 TaxID=3345871 RepID=UPI0036A05CDA
MGLEILFGSSRRELSLSQVVDKIIFYNEKIQGFWSNAHGWAPTLASDALNKARLDRQVSLSHTLKRWIDIPDENDPEYEGMLILAWANLGALTENTLKFFLTVYLESYITDQDAITIKNQIQAPGDASFDRLRDFFKKKIWDDKNKAERDKMILTIQQRRNGIHAFNDRDIAAFKEFHEAVFYYLEVLEELNTRVPYPD